MVNKKMKNQWWAQPQYLRPRRCRFAVIGRTAGRISWHRTALAAYVGWIKHTLGHDSVRVKDGLEPFFHIVKYVGGRWWIDEPAENGRL